MGFTKGRVDVDLPKGVVLKLNIIGFEQFLSFFTVKLAATYTLSLVIRLVSGLQTELQACQKDVIRSSDILK
ncbi:hypothetical protein GTO89_15050 [Heliobacterium gestii]|uniref:Uncharacterized protein n=1 Tax=Heliomicrobium gestii TaxID=2699 RepID=A0A845LIF7_HELGE|nr:hypothetical protein [Heliomicrobium gestii]MBM7868123.1 hypothetical protein [Heliomicrobium gestii]MZP44349.1 hypothetical protein [Heliomicrobium gestii]